MLLGAALGTLPDLDVLIDYGGDVENYTYHRGFSHSLFVLAPFAALLWLALRRWWAPVRAAPGRWLAAILLALVTHPLLDAHTAYGTQLWWPLASPPVAWSTIFIIDPLYTLPLAVGVIAAAARPLSRGASTLLAVGLVLSTAYLGWSWLGKALVERQARAALVDLGLDSVPLFSVPTPFNTLLWRLVVLTEDGHLEGLYSLATDEGPIRFIAFGSDNASLEAASDLWAVQRLCWFTRGFLRARVVNDTLLLADLRMGQEPYYVFTHVVAVRGNPHWHAVETRRLPPTLDTGLLAYVWYRMWSGDQVSH